jgi:hypothetical protein
MASAILLEKVIENDLKTKMATFTKSFNSTPHQKGCYTRLQQNKVYLDGGKANHLYDITEVTGLGAAVLYVPLQSL